MLTRRGLRSHYKAIEGVPNGMQSGLDQEVAERKSRKREIEHSGTAVNPEGRYGPAVPGRQNVPTY